MLLKKGMRGADVQKLQEGLALLSVACRQKAMHPGGADGHFGGKTEDAVEAFQSYVGLWADGLFGKGSVREWNALITTKGIDTHYQFGVAVVADPVEASGDKLSWVKCPADPQQLSNGKTHGYGSTTLRSDTAKAYKALYDDVHAHGGILTSAGGKRNLASGAGPARSKKSFHYTGRAFDMATYSAMQNPDKDPILTVRVEDTRKFTVWCKVLDDKAPLAAQVPVVTLRCAYVKHLGKRKTQLAYREWTGQAFNFTEMAANLGFEPISGRRSFFSGGDFMGSEWWHMQWTKGLIKGESTFGEELLKVYTLAECKQFIYWDEAKDAVFGVDWF